MDVSPDKNPANLENMASPGVVHPNKTHVDNIDPIQPHSVHVNNFEQKFSHQEAKWPLMSSRERRTPLKYPRANDPIWKSWDDELSAALPLIFPKRTLDVRSLEKFEKWLYDFVCDKFEQHSEPHSSDFCGSNTDSRASVVRCKSALVQLRNQKKELTKFMKNMKTANLWFGDIARTVTKTWRKLLKRHNNLRKRITYKIRKRNTARADTKFRKDPFKYASNLFSGVKIRKDPSFSAEEAEEYFVNTYTDSNRKHLHIPLHSMRRPPPPQHTFNLEPLDFRTFSDIVQKKSNGTSPSFNGLNYVIYKRCHSARKWLHLIMRSIGPSNLPLSWAIALGVLVFKDGLPSIVSNFRPIMMADCSGKLFFTNVARQLETFVVVNGFIDRSKQKGFLSKVAGCIEHTFMLQEALRDSKSHYRQLVISWLDLWNAYGSVPHNLIQFALSWYHVPDEICELIFRYYEMLQASVQVNKDQTGFFRFEIGFFQGCVLAAILFDLVFNMMLDLLKPLTKTHGYKFKTRDVTILDLAYADDESNLTSTPKANQETLNIIDNFLVWSRTMKAKPIKCFSFAQKFFKSNDMTGYKPMYENQSFSPFDPLLTISGKPITFIGDTKEKQFKFLGWKMYTDLSEKKTKEELRQYFQDLMTAVDLDPVNGFIKLWLYQHYILLMFSWPFQVNNLDNSFVLELEASANKYLKKWAGIFRNAKLSLLYGPRSQFGLGLTPISLHYKQCQVSKCFILKHCDDSAITNIYQQRVARETKLSKIWRPSPVLENLESEVHFNDKFAGQLNRHGLGFDTNELSFKDKIKSTMKKHFHDALHSSDCTKALQGVWTTFHDCIPFDLSWNHLIGSRNTPLISWVLNASINSVCTPDMLKLWKYKSDASCVLCGHHQASLSHILSNCNTALQQKRYTWRHDSVLFALKAFLEIHICTINAKSPKPVTDEPRKISFVKANELSPECPKPDQTHLLSSANDWQLLVDFDHANIVFPVNICVTRSRPDIIIWSQSTRKVILIELTCPMEENVLDARKRKNARYRDNSSHHAESLVDQIEGNDWSSTLFTIEVCCRGMVSNSVIRCLRKLGFTRTQTKKLTNRLSSVVAGCSFAIYRCHKVKTWQSKPLVETKSSSYLFSS